MTPVSIAASGTHYAAPLLTTAIIAIIATTAITTISPEQATRGLNEMRTGPI